MVGTVPSLGHVAVGMAAGRLYAGRGAGARRLLKATVAFSLVSVLPDADVIAFALRIPYQAPFGHRGASHSFAVALMLGLVALASARWLKLEPSKLALSVVLVAASHGVLDTFTDGGLGCALLWPFSKARFFSSFRPIPVAPIGARLWSARGLSVFGAELGLFAPFWLYALWPRRGEPSRPRQGASPR